MPPVSIDRRTPQGVFSPWRQRLMRELNAGTAVAVVASEAVDGLLPSLTTDGRICVEGDLGDYALTNFAGGDASVRGNVGYATACGMSAGSLELIGDAGAMLAANCRGGSVLLKGRCGADCAAAMRQGDVCVTGDVGPRCGHAMSGGTLVLFGSAGPGMGYRMTGGTIFLRGFAERVDSAITESRIRETERLRLSLILLKANVDASPKDFRTYRPIATRELSQ